jgi:hypothetical protein
MTARLRHLANPNKILWYTDPFIILGSFVTFLLYVQLSFSFHGLQNLISILVFKNFIYILYIFTHIRIKDILVTLYMVHWNRIRNWIQRLTAHRQYINTSTKYLEQLVPGKHSFVGIWIKSCCLICLLRFVVGNLMLLHSAQWGSRPVQRKCSQLMLVSDYRHSRLRFSYLL